MEPSIKRAVCCKVEACLTRDAHAEYFSWDHVTFECYKGETCTAK